MDVAEQQYIDEFNPTGYEIYPVSINMHGASIVKIKNKHGKDVVDTVKFIPSIFFLALSFARFFKKLIVNDALLECLQRAMLNIFSVKHTYSVLKLDEINSEIEQEYDNCLIEQSEEGFPKRLDTSGDNRHKFSSNSGSDKVSISNPYDLTLMVADGKNWVDEINFSTNSGRDDTNWCGINIYYDTIIFFSLL